LREYDQARKDYQQALQIFIEFGDRYSESIVYSQLGSLAESMDDIPESIAYHLKALEIRVELNDKYRLDLTIGNLSRLYKSHPSPQFLSQTSQALGVGEAEVLQMFESVGGG
jgi:tetratricopeptide (TPR) repeat protein